MSSLVIVPIDQYLVVDGQSQPMKKKKGKRWGITDNAKKESKKVQSKSASKQTTPNRFNPSFKLQRPLQPHSSHP
jgi:hypothetical protein